MQWSYFLDSYIEVWTKYQGGAGRRTKKASQGNKRCSKEVALRYLLLWCKPIFLLLSISIFQDDASESMKEMSTRARRTRKSAQEEAASGRLERQTSKDNRKDSKDGWRDSKDDISKKVSHDRYYFTDSHFHQHFFVPCLCHQLDNWHNNHTCTSSSWAENYNFSTLKRRNTGKKMDADKVRFEFRYLVLLCFSYILLLFCSRLKQLQAEMERRRKPLTQESR